MDNEDIPISIHKGRPTKLFIDIQICEKFGINPLDYFYSEEWMDRPELKATLFAYHQLVVEEENRQNEEINKKIKSKNNSDDD